MVAANRACTNRNQRVSGAMLVTISVVVLALPGLVRAAPSFTIQRTAASPNPVQRDASTTITTTIASTGPSASGILVDMEVHSAGGGKVYQQSTSNQNFAAGERKTLRWSWSVPATQAPGSYTIKIGVFSSTWSTLYAWSNNAGTLAVAGGVSLTVGKGGAGGGTVTSAPAGIDCGADCTEGYASGTAVTLTATPAAGSVFAGWSGGGCSGTGPCVLTVAAATSVVATFGAAAGALPALPSGWPGRLELGMVDSPGGAAQLRATGQFAFRYHYLAGGVNTGAGWASWLANGGFVTDFVQESVQNGFIPVFSYYMLAQSAPGNAQPEADGVYTNLQTAATMRAFYKDLTLFFQRAGASGGSPVVLHVEPDLWGYMQQRASGDDAATVRAQVAATALSDLAGLPNTVAGMAQAVRRLRDRYAPNVLLAYPLSVWGTGVDIDAADPPDSTVDVLAVRAGNWYQSLGAAFDIAFAEFADRDAGYYQYHLGRGNGAWWDAADHARMARFLAGFVGIAAQRVVMWQIPLGNTKMLAMDNTWRHFQDNLVEWFLDDPTRTHLGAYVQAGVVAFLFGPGGDGATCACDAARDGVTNPPPVNGNGGVSLSADDDGGFFRQKAWEYYAGGAIALD